MNKKGFTLVEMIAVVVMLGLVASIAIMSISGQRAKINEKEKKTLNSSIVGALQNYRVNNTVNPGDKITLDKLKFTNNLSYSNNECKNLNQSYIKYVLKGEIDNNSSLEEIFCIRFYCNDVKVINDFETNSKYCK